jgi:hypothetical protein
MFSNTYFPVIRQPATRVATGTLAALLLVAFAQPASASDATRVGPEPHWSSRIGTGQPFVKGSERRQPLATAPAPLHDASASAHWSARIGTGRAVSESRTTPGASSTAGVAPPTHWTARIGTGRASPGMDVGKPAERKGPAEARAIAEPLGEHPAALVARSWSRHGIDPNTFIVRHPAGSTWVNASPTATENATSDTDARAVRTASASSK